MFGGRFHKSTEYTDQMWCDGQYMGPALLAQIIKHTGKTNNISDNDWDIIAKQFSITWAQLYDKNTGLLYHGFTANPGDDASKSWAGISKEKESITLHPFGDVPTLGISSLWLTFSK